MQTNSNSPFNLDPHEAGDRTLKRVFDHLARTMERDSLVQETADRLRLSLQIDRVVLYYFYREWKGRVTFESVSSPNHSIFGSTGPDECFNGEYAGLYEAGRVRAIADIESESIAPCHREFLRAMQVRANLVVPILTPKGLWGLLVAHHCQSIRPWSISDIGQMQAGAQTLSTAPSIQDS